MFFQKKKKEFSEISESKLNINADYFDMFKNEFENLFPNKNNKNNKNYKNDKNDKNDENNENDKNNENDENDENNENDENKIKKMSNSIIKNVELTDNDIFFINLFVKTYKKNKKLN